MLPSARQESNFWLTGKEITVKKQNTLVRALGAVLFSVAFAALPARAADRCKVDETVSAKNSTYTEQHVMNIDDPPGHVIRMFESSRAYPDDKPNCEGLKRVKALTHSMSDYVDGNGPLHGYTTIVFENGDKIFGEVHGVSQTVVGPDGSKKGTFAGILRYTGGTGKYVGVRGLIRETIDFDIAKGYNQARDEGDYWIEK